MMWLCTFMLLLFNGGNDDLYWQAVASAQRGGCHVYNDYYVSCPVNWVPAFALIPIPADAVEVVIPDGVLNND